MEQDVHISNGFTLVEVLMAMFVGLVVLAAIYAVYVTQHREYSRQEQITEMHQNARMAMDMMSKDIMMAGYGPSNHTRCSGTGTATNCVGITSANATSISITADLNDNKSITADTSNPHENISYYLYSSDGITTLGRVSNGTLQPAVENISALTFAYLDSAGTATTNLAFIRTVQITLTAKTAKIDPNLNTFHTYTLTSNVEIRNAGTSGFNK